MNGRITAAADAPAEGERVVRLAVGHGFSVEQILSGALSAPQDYEQDHDEWVVVLQGEADLEVEGRVLTLVAGDWLLIPGSTPHRLLRTEPATRWLAVHVQPG